MSANLQDFQSPGITEKCLAPLNNSVCIGLAQGASGRSSLWWLSVSAPGRASEEVLVRNGLESRNLLLKLSALEANREHRSLFCPPSNRIKNSSGKVHSEVSSVFFKHTSEEL